MYEHSNCCNAPVTVQGEEEWNADVTKFYVCTKCDNPTDTH